MDSQTALGDRRSQLAGAAVQKDRAGYKAKTPGTEFQGFMAPAAGLEPATQ